MFNAYIRDLLPPRLNKCYFDISVQEFIVSRSQNSSQAVCIPMKLLKLSAQIIAFD